MELGSETTLGANEHIDDPVFKDFYIQVYNGSSVLLREVYTVNPEFTYTHDMNFNDTSGSPARTIRVVVYARGKQNQLSTYGAQLTVTNPAPSAPTVGSTSAASQTAFVQLLPVNDNDIAGYMCWMSTTNGFTPSGVNLSDVGTNLKFRGMSNEFVITGLLPATTYYFQCAAFDKFGTDSLNYTTQFAITTIQFSDVDLVDGAIVEAKLATNAVSLAKMQADSIGSAQLVANAVVAGKISNNAVTASTIAARCGCCWQVRCSVL